MLPRLTLHQRMFVEELIRTKEPLQAALAAYNIREGIGRNHIASSIAYENMRKDKIRAYIDNFCVSNEELVFILKAGLNATKSITNPKTGKLCKVADWTTRVKVIELTIAVKGSLDNLGRMPSDKHRRPIVKFIKKAYNRGKDLDVGSPS